MESLLTNGLLEPVEAMERGVPLVVSVLRVGLPPAVAMVHLKEEVEMPPLVQLGFRMKSKDPFMPGYKAYEVELEDQSGKELFNPELILKAVIKDIEAAS